MGALMVTKTSPTGKSSVEVDINELILRLKTLEKGCNIEIVQLAISSMLEEIEDTVGQMPES